MNDSEFVAKTKDHIEEVGKNICLVTSELNKRAIIHDSSKLRNPEYSGFKECTEKLAGLTYGSYEYKKQLEEMKPFLDHHYKNNRHHPEYFQFKDTEALINGFSPIKDMTLVDIIEMLCDWLAATKRHNDGDIYKSIELNQKRFGYSEDLKQIFINTVDEILK